MTYPTYLVAECGVHGVHGERDRCLVCNRPVGQIQMVRVEHLLATLDERKELKTQLEIAEDERNEAEWLHNQLL